MRPDEGSSLTAGSCCELPLTSEEIPSDEQDFYHLFQVFISFSALPG